MGITGTRALVQAWNKVMNKAQTLHASYSALKTIDTEHERIHAGMAWLNKDEYFVPPSTTFYYLFHVDSFTNPCHIRNFGFVTDNGPMKLHFRESPFIDVNSQGVELSLNNMNRNSGNLSGMALHGGPVIDVNSLGYHLDFIYAPESAPGNQPAKCY